MNGNADDATRMSPDEPVLVTGASGFVGSHTARLLVREGRTVRVLLRKTSRQDALENLPLEIFYGDALEPDTLRKAMAGCCTVFHSVVDPRFWLSDPAPLFRNNVEGLTNTMDVALECGVKRFVFTSTIGTLGQNSFGPVTEDTKFNWFDKAPPYIRSRCQAENRFFAYCRDKGLPGVALCVSNTYGPQDFQPTPQGKMLWEVSTGKVRFVWNAHQPTVDIRDAAEAMLLAETRGKPGERYIISNEFLTYEQLFAMAAAEGGNGPPIVLPQSAAFAAAWTGECLMKLLRRRDYLVRTDAVYLSAAFGELDSSKARKELGWKPRAMAETVRDAIAWFAQRNAVADVGMAPIFGRW